MPQIEASAFTPSAAGLCNRPRQIHASADVTWVGSRTGFASTEEATSQLVRNPAEPHIGIDRVRAGNEFVQPFPDLILDMTGNPSFREGSSVTMLVSILGRSPCPGYQPCRLPLDGRFDRAVSG